MIRRGFRRALGALAVAAILPFLLAGRAFALPVVSGATLVSNPANNSNSYTFSWQSTVDASSPTAPVTYIVISTFGFSYPGINPNAPGVTSASVVNQSTLKVFMGSGSRCFVIVASTTVSGIYAATPFTTDLCHSYMHQPGGTNYSGILRADGNGTQLGFNQTWNLTYYLDTDSLVTLSIYPPATTFAADPSGFQMPVGNPTPTKVLVDHIPRSGELASANVSNTEIWDSRNSSGATVGNGIYFAHFIITNPLFSPTTRYTDVFTIPVNIIRFTAFSTTGITPTVATANINYTVTANSTIRIVIAKPGRKFTVDANGDVQSLDATGTVIDTSTNSVVQVLSYNRAAGTWSDTWNGQDSGGVAVSTGLYTVGVSAKDTFANRALDLSGNNGPLQGSIPVDRTPAQSAGPTAPPTISAISVSGTNISLGGGTAVNPFTTIAFTLSATAGTGANISVVNLTGPSGLIAGGAVSASANVVTYSTTAVLSATGTYTAVITAKDVNGNVSAPLSYSFVIPTSGASVGGTTQDQGTFAASVIPYPNPVKVGPAKIDFTLAAAATVDIDIFTITGNRVFHQSNSYASGSQTFSWSVVNDASSQIANGIYIVQVTANNSLQKLRARKKLLIVK